MSDFQTPEFYITSIYNKEYCFRVRLSLNLPVPGVFDVCHALGQPSVFTSRFGKRLVWYEKCFGRKAAQWGSKTEISKLHVLFHDHGLRILKRPWVAAEKDSSELTNEGVVMKLERQIDELIKAGWGVVDSDFDPVAFQHWRVKAFECLTTMFGPDHVYTKYFEQFVRRGEKSNVLAAGGVLVAAKEQMKSTVQDAVRVA